MADSFIGAAGTNPQKVKLIDQGDGTYAVATEDQGGAAGGDATAAKQDTQITAANLTNTNLGGVTETAPATDTASSGLNGRLQRIAQRITSLIALLPASLGVKLPATSLSVIGAQWSGVPSNFAIGTANATVFTLAAGERGFIQNLDDAVLAVKLGASAAADSFSMLLKAGTGAADGTGGYISIENYVGAVSVFAMTGTASYIAWKQA